MSSNKAEVFFFLRKQVIDSRVRQKCSAVLSTWQLKSNLSAVYSVIKSLRKASLMQAFVTIKSKGLETRSLKKKLEKFERDNEELARKLAKAGSDESVKKFRQVVKELQEENRNLKEKLVQTEQNVGVFVKEMACLLDQHQPEGLRRAEVEAAISQVRRPAKVRVRSRVNPISPERTEGVRRGDKSHKVQFD